MANSTREPMGEDFLEILEGIRLTLSYLGTGRPPGSTSRGALELVAGSISGEDGSLAECLRDGLAGIRDALDRLHDAHYVGLNASARFRHQPADAFRKPDETVHEFLSDWFILSDDADARIPRRRVNELYVLWCEHNEISPEDRVTTSVLRRSLMLLGVGLVQGHTDSKRARTWVFTGIKIRDGVPAR